MVFPIDNVLSIIITYVRVLAWKHSHVQPTYTRGAINTILFIYTCSTIVLLTVIPLGSCHVLMPCL